ncbi:DUF6084 family protein [Arthrobacter sp. H14]|uniref:DUF6084 family protein n=1 Tax=Arthrobacter sp. H14 TaxID=1312959 RepID=UPI00047CF4B2|nr:DUF6084 family protein [Arthrobacter sp. H14]
MTQLDFDVLNIFAEPYGATPQLTARLRLLETTGAVIHAIALRCQVRIEPQRRGYAEEEEPGLQDLFGDRARWPSTLKPFLWLHSSTTVQGFTGATDVDLPLPCTYDFEVTASKYLHALRERSVPLALLFSGTIFTKGSNGFGVEQISWNCEASYQLPVAVWRALMDQYFPNTGWIRMDREIVQALAQYKSSLGLTSWDTAVQSLLANAPDPVR